MKRIKSLIFVGTVLCLWFWSTGCAQQSPTKEVAKPKEETVTLRCGRSHAGGFRYIPCEMTISDKGIRWRFLEEFERDEFIPWGDLDEWEAWGKTYGYQLTLKVSKFKDGGGRFKFSNSDLEKVVQVLRRHAPNKKQTPGGWR
jgi:hypothetical protein